MQKHIMMVQHKNGTAEIECANCGNPMTVEKFDPAMQELYYCAKCGEYSNDDPREVDPTVCPECGAQERREIDIVNTGTCWEYVYACGNCGHVWTVNVRKTEE